MQTCGCDPRCSPRHRSVLCAAGGGDVSISEISSQTKVRDVINLFNINFYAKSTSLRRRALESSGKLGVGDDCPIRLILLKIFCMTLKRTKLGPTTKL